jgi:crossover junction endodeoxyribonuclease RuvC
MHGPDATHVWHSVIETDAGIPFPDRLQAVRNDLRETVRRFEPAVACLEDLFFQSNAKTAMKVAMARGAILLTLADLGIPTVELTPSQVKSGIAGWGSANKRQVEDMVVRLLRLSEIPKPDDAADALALALVGGLIYRQNESHAFANRIKNH